MDKKMKAVALASSPYSPYMDGKSNSKHKALLQDYQELQKETMAARNRLETMKQRKFTLTAEVRFLRRRYKYLLEKKAEKPSQVVELKQKKKVNEKSFSRKEVKQRKLAPVAELNHQERILNAKATNKRNRLPVLDLNLINRMHNNGNGASLINSAPVFDLNHKQRSHGAKEFKFLSPRPVLDLNLKESTPRNPSLAFDLNQTEINHAGREDAVQNRAPIFDLNLISGEEELQDNYEPPRMEEQKMFLTRSAAEEQLNDLKLAACRNVGNGPNRAVKRKVSWLDQVALKV